MPHLGNQQKRNQQNNNSNIMKKISIITVLLLNALFAFSQITYQYDNLNRLSKVTYQNGTTVSYTYDELGNRTQKTVTQGAAIDSIAVSAIKIWSADGLLYIDAQEVIESIEIYDLTGHLLYRAETVISEIVISGLPQKQVIIVAIRKKDGATEQKKVIL
jgi:YD repeat-containing protein